MFMSFIRPEPESAGCGKEGWISGLPEPEPDIWYITSLDIPEPGFCYPAGTGYFRMFMSAIRPKQESAGCGRISGQPEPEPDIRYIPNINSHTAERRNGGEGGVRDAELRERGRGRIKGISWVYQLASVRFVESEGAGKGAEW
jgi:hypothetical protein